MRSDSLSAPSLRQGRGLSPSRQHLISAVMIYTAIDTFYVSDDEIRNSPSRKDGIDESTETMVRFYGCELIQESGILLKLPQAVMATGQVLLQRFYCKKSFARFNAKRVAASCVWLAGKLEECPRKIQHVLNVFHRMECHRENKPCEPLDPFSKKYEELKIDLIRTERHLLKEMGFICHVEHPHKFIINYLTQLEASPELMQEAWNLANDSLRTTLCARFKSEVIACGVVYAASRRFRLPLPENPPWWKVFSAEKNEIDEVCRVLANLYRKPKACYIEVSKDTKSFVLISRAWDPPPEGQDNLLKTTSVNGTTQGCVMNRISEGKESIVRIALDKLKSSKLVQEAKFTGANGDLRDDDSGAVVGHLGDDDDVIAAKNREKDRGKVKSRQHEWAREHDRERECGKTRDYEKERDRGRNKDKDIGKEKEKLKKHYRTKERIKESGYLERNRHHSSSRDREYTSSIAREKERHRHHPYA